MLKTQRNATCTNIMTTNITHKEGKDCDCSTENYKKVRFKAQEKRFLLLWRAQKEAKYRRSKSTGLLVKKLISKEARDSLWRLNVWILIRNVKRGALEWTSCRR